MIFQRIGTKKHKYILELILISIKYCPWDSPYIKVSLIRGNISFTQEILMKRQENTASTKDVVVLIISTFLSLAPCTTITKIRNTFPNKLRSRSNPTTKIKNR